MKSDRGASVMVCVGRYAGWRIRRDGRSLRITVGWLGITLAPFDYEVFLGNVRDAIDYMTAENERLRAHPDTERSEP